MKIRQKNVLLFERLIFVTAHYLYGLRGYFKDCGNRHVEKLPSFSYKRCEMQSFLVSHAVVYLFVVYLGFLGAFNTVQIYSSAAFVLNGLLMLLICAEEKLKSPLKLIIRKKNQLNRSPKDLNQVP